MCGVVNSCGAKYFILLLLRKVVMNGIYVSPDRPTEVLAPVPQKVTLFGNRVFK